MSDDDVIVRTLRAAAAPDLAPGAADRIAAGAWDRAAELRLRGFPRRRIVRRIGFTAAAAAVLVGAVYALRGPETAFAVEGDPVMVRRGDEWIAAREVPFDVLVRAPAGARVLRSRDGDVLRPRPGSVFRLARDTAFARPLCRAEFVEGGGDVDGAGFVVSIRDEVVVERDPSAATFRLSFAVGDGAPRFEVSAGRAFARARGTNERLALATADRAAFLSVNVKGAVERRFARLESWSDAAAARIAKGALPLLDADFDGAGGITLVGGTNAGDFLAFDVPRQAVRDAMRCVNDASARRLLVTLRATQSAPKPPTRYVYEKDAVRVTLDVAGDGRVVVESGGGSTNFASVAAFRREAPGLASLFGDALKE